MSASNGNFIHARQVSVLSRFRQRCVGRTQLVLAKQERCIYWTVSCGLFPKAARLGADLPMNLWDFHKRVVNASLLSLVEQRQQ
jgi:hypothetical protein